MSAPDQLRPLRRTLKRTFGLESLRPGQAEVIRAVLAAEDVLAIMPTGAGKSLCYQLPALHLEGTTVVISPLIALMKDQTDKLGELGLDAAQVNSAVPRREQASALAAIEAARSEFVLTTPERLADSQFLETLSEATIDFVVVDEAHCISQWGHDFRPAYLDVRHALEVLGKPPVLALTATATPDVADDIRRQLAGTISSTTSARSCGRCHAISATVACTPWRHRSAPTPRSACARRQVRCGARSSSATGWNCRSTVKLRLPTSTDTRSKCASPMARSGASWRSMPAP
jgi:superfamily II DNA helicase RecQ